MSARRIVAVLSLLCAGLLAQGARYDSTTTALFGQAGSLQQVIAIPGTKINVCTGVYTGTPCTSATATVYSDLALTQPITQPIVSDGNANFGFYAAGGNYFYTATPPVGSIGSAGSVTVTLTGSTGGSTFTSITVNGNGALFSAHVNGDTSPSVFGVAGSGTMSTLQPTKTISVVPTGGGATTWTYNGEELVGGTSLGTDTPSSAANASTLSSSVFNTLSVVCQSTRDTVQFHRTAGSLSSGVISTPQSCSTGTASLQDTGLTASSSQLGEPVNESGMAIQPFVWLKQSGGEAQMRTGPSGASIQLPDFFSSCTAIFGCASGGINFGDNDAISLGWLNANGSIATPSLIFGATNSTHTYVNVASASCGLGFGGVSYSGNAAAFPSTYVGPGGSSENSVLLSSVGNTSCGAANNPEFIGPIQAFATSLGDTNVVGQSSSRSNVSLCRPSSSACAIPALYSVTFYIEDGNLCNTPGSAGVTLSVTYVDETGSHTIPVVLHQSDGTSATNFALGSGNRQGSGQVVLWSTVAGGVEPGWSAAYTVCGAGTAKYTVHASITRLN